MKSKASMASLKSKTKDSKKKRGKKSGMSKKTSVHSAKLVSYPRVNKSSHSIEPHSAWR